MVMGEDWDTLFVTKIRGMGEALLYTATLMLEKI
jgi:hypothetical protein